MYQKHIRLIFYPKEPFFSLIISCFLISFFSPAASHPWPPSTVARPQSLIPGLSSQPPVYSPISLSPCLMPLTPSPVSPKLGHLANIHPPNLSLSMKKVDSGLTLLLV